MKEIALTWQEYNDLTKVVTELLPPLLRLRINAGVIVGQSESREYRVKIEEGGVKIKLVSEVKNG